MGASAACCAEVLAVSCRTFECILGSAFCKLHLLARVVPVPCSGVPLVLHGQLFGQCCLCCCACCHVQVQGHAASSLSSQDCREAGCEFLIHACRRLKDTVHIAQTIAATIGAESDSPFEFRVLEALLAETAHHFEGKSRQASAPCGIQL